MKRFAAVALLLAFTLVAAGCGGFSEAAQGTSKTTAKSTAKSTGKSK
jgi:hypothetical protein